MNSLAEIDAATGYTDLRRLFWLESLRPGDKVMIKVMIESYRRFPATVIAVTNTEIQLETDWSGYRWVFPCCGEFGCPGSLYWGRMEPPDVMTS